MEARKAKDIKNQSAFDMQDYFDITALRTGSVNEVFDDDDFVCPPKESGREKVAVKMGRIYMEFEPGGKGSFILRVYSIDKTNHRLNVLLDYNNTRYFELMFEELVPVRLSAYYPTMTVMGRRSNDPHKLLLDQLCEASKLARFIITELALDHEVDMDFVYQAFHSFNIAFTALETARKQAYAQNSPMCQVNNANRLYSAAKKPEKQVQRVEAELAGKLDVLDFMRKENKSQPPRNVFELAAKIVSVYMAELGLSEATLTDLFVEYLTATGKQATAIYNDRFINRLASTLIDGGKYSIKMLLPDDSNDGMVKMAIVKAALKLEQPNPAEIIFENSHQVANDQSGRRNGGHCTIS